MVRLAKSSREIIMSYVDALLDRQKERIHVVERVDGKRIYTEYPVVYTFYYADPRGKWRSIFDTPVSRVSTRSSKEFRKELAIHNGKQLFESDINPIFRCLEDNYLNKDAPELNIAFFDIETDFDNKRGYSTPADPFTKITAITMYLNWMDQLITLALPPESMSIEQANQVGAKFDNTFMFENEADLLLTFLDLIEDADILSGWNSGGFDIPYMVNRVARVLSKDDTRRFCLWNQFPKERIFEKYGADQLTFDLVGRVHMDYMELYRKYTYEERHSYSLDAIGEYELNERKTAYEGSLDQLYNQDFETFITYSRQDVALLDKLDKKLRFIDLANELAHANTVLLQTTMGAVAVTEQAIINEAHRRGMVVPNRKQKTDTSETQVAGAYVAYPKKGLHQYIGAIDINSLYPSAIRALNMGPETVIGQLRPIMTDAYIADKIARGSSMAAAWEGLFGSLEYEAMMKADPATEITVDWENGESESYSAKQLYNFLFNTNKPWCISANGTIFNLEKQGVIPGLLERWYAERKELQAKMRASTDAKERAFWDKRQLVKKINLNSLYGAILNGGCRFFDQRIGQSTTLGGRAIARHMDATVNQMITGEYDHVGESIIYGDTDSVYFSAWPIIKADVTRGDMEWNKDICVKLYDQISDQVNATFPDFMHRAFHTTPELGEIIKGGRELVAASGLFITKKRYAVLIYDLEGKRLDSEGKSGKVKAMGLDLKRSDTPKVVQDFLSEILKQTLDGADKSEIIQAIRDFKLEFKERPAWEKGTPKRVNKLTYYGDLEKKQGRANMPGHVRAAINWNHLRRMHSDNRSIEITDGMKTIVCKLRSNPLGLTSIGYPTDESRIPQWFKELPFDQQEMEDTIVTQKVDNLLGVLDWDLENATRISNTFNSLFE
jgi:DNA polymerase elongation subunit (family B)